MGIFDFFKRTSNKRKAFINKYGDNPLVLLEMALKKNDFVHEYELKDFQRLVWRKSTEFKEDNIRYWEKVFKDIWIERHIDAGYNINDIDSVAVMVRTLELKIEKYELVKNIYAEYIGNQKQIGEEPLTHNVEIYNIIKSVISGAKLASKEVSFNPIENDKKSNPKINSDLSEDNAAVVDKLDVLIKGLEGIKDTGRDKPFYDFFDLEDPLNEVHSNEKLRETLKNRDANNNTIDSFEVELKLRGSVTHETGVNIEGLEYKGFKYDALGGYHEEIVSATFSKDNDGNYLDERLNSLDGFLKAIGQKEISHLDNVFNIHWESTKSEHYPFHYYIKEVKWLDNPPIEIIEEFRNKYADNIPLESGGTIVADYNYETLAKEIYDMDKIDYDGQSECLNEYSNYEHIILRFKIKEKIHEIKWINDAPFGYSDYWNDFKKKNKDGV